jgi:hypothetical protein
MNVLHTHAHTHNNTGPSLVDSAGVYWQAYDSSHSLQHVDIATGTTAQTLNMKNRDDTLSEVGSTSNPQP